MGEVATKDGPPEGRKARKRAERPRARKVRRVVRHIEPWSVLRVSVLFFLAVFLILCVTSALLWNAARSAGQIENVEEFITSVGGFGNCEPIEGASTTPPAEEPAAADQVDPAATTTLPPGVVDPAAVEEGEDCPEGEELVGAFKFEDGRILESFALGGVVLVLAGTAGAVVLTLLFNLMSDLTGGVRVTVLEEEPLSRQRAASGSPARPPRE